MLYVVSTPIGNLADITLRALETLFSSELILCEDTRKTLALLKHFQKPELAIPSLVSFFEENELTRMPEIVTKLKQGQNIALVSNGGTPAISDPGFKLVRECLKEKIKVVSVPGPSSPIASLSVSGLPTDKFLFLGFLPNKSGARIKLLEKVKKTQADLSSTVIFLESPFRLVKNLLDLKSVFGDIKVVICRELTKIYEETENQNISYFLEKYKKNNPKGELVVLFSLKTQEGV